MIAGLRLYIQIKTNIYIYSFRKPILIATNHTQIVKEPKPQMILVDLYHLQGHLVQEKSSIGKPLTMFIFGLALPYYIVLTCLTWCQRSSQGGAAGYHVGDMPSVDNRGGQRGKTSYWRPLKLTTYLQV